MDAEGVRVGDRVSCEGYVGTVKYVGKVPPTSGVWLGINWDDPTKGKHNGSHGSVSYFETTTESSGSFVRPSKCSFGISFMDAVRRKYVVLRADETDISNEDDADEHVIDVLEHKNVLFVGARGIMKEQSSLSTLKNIILRKCDVSRACSGAEESHLNGSERRSVPVWLPSAFVLDISENLFTDWKEIEIILKHLPFLKFLNIQSNKFSEHLPSYALIKEEIEKAPHKYRQLGDSEHSILNEICLNNLGWNWETVLCSIVSLAASRLEFLIASFNKIETIDLRMWKNLSDFIFWKPFSLLTSLNLEGNPIKSWNEILKLAFIMPALETLILNFCGINEIFFPATLEEADCILSNITSPSSQILNSSPENTSASSKTTIFPKLAKLSLDRNNISSWSSINELNKLQNLTNLNMSSNPIDEGTATWDKWSHKVAARLSGLTYLNRVKINRLDRRGAEIDYLNFCAQELGITQVSESFLERHPRYNELVSKYGAPDLQPAVAKVAEVKAGLVLVNIAFVIQRLDSSTKEGTVMRSVEHVISVVTRRLPRTMPIERLKMMMKKVFKKDLGGSGLNPVDDDHISLSYSSFSSLKSSDSALTREDGELQSMKTSDDRMTVTSPLSNEMSNLSFPNNFIFPGVTLEIPLDDPFKELGYFSVADQDTLYVRLL